MSLTKEYTLNHLFGSLYASGRIIPQSSHTSTFVGIPVSFKDVCSQAPPRRSGDPAALRRDLGLASRACKLQPLEVADRRFFYRGLGFLLS